MVETSGRKIRWMELEGGRDSVQDDELRDLRGSERRRLVQVEL